MLLIFSCHCLCPFHWSQVLIREWRCSWSSADRWCSNYIWVINNVIAYWGSYHIRGLTVYILAICTWSLNIGWVQYLKFILEEDKRLSVVRNQYHNCRDSPTIWCLAFSPTLLQFYVPFHVKKEKINDFMYLLEFKCAKRLKGTQSDNPCICRWFGNIWRQAIYRNGSDIVIMEYSISHLSKSNISYWWDIEMEP